MMYTKRNECTSFWTWLWCSWNFITRTGSDFKREIGWRRFGWEHSKFYDLPPGRVF